MRLALLVVASGSFMLPADAGAQPVSILWPSGRVALRDDPYVPPGDLPASPEALSLARANGSTSPVAEPARASRSPARRRAPVPQSARAAITELMRRRMISSAAYRIDIETINTALGALHRLRGRRASELGAVLRTLHEIAVRGQLTASRLPALILTVDRNRRWWTAGPLLSRGQRVEFGGSELVWEYYAGQGIELQELGSFGKADGLFTAGQRARGRFAHLLAELVSVASRRAGGMAWEYYFRFESGSAPWTSAMSQGTALEALTRAFRAFGNRAYLTMARRALPVLSAAVPEGTSVMTPRGRRFVLYSFAPGEKVLNGFLQTLIGLYDYARASGDQQAWRLFAAGDREARSEVPHYDTGRWSLYEPGQPDSVDYHVLVTGFLHGLCDRLHARVYCVTAGHFEAYLRQRLRRR